MPLNGNGQYVEIVEAEKYLPSISLIMPFDPKINLKKELDHKLKVAFDKIKNELAEDYPENKITPVLEKLQNTIDELDYDTHKKSIAIFVSPLIKKVYYLNIRVEEKIIIDESFEVRDLIFSKSQTHKYLLLLVSNKEANVYLGNSTHLIPVALDVPDKIEAYKTDMPPKVANFSDENEEKEILLDKFLRSIDNGLSLLLQSYKLPVFIMSTIKTIGHFKKITHNEKDIIEYIPGNFEKKSLPDLHKIMQPNLISWKKVLQDDLLKQIDDAMSHKKVSVGIHEVWKAASQKKGRLLLVEKNFIYPAQQGAEPGTIFSYGEINNDLYIKDAVDDTIEKVLESGGDVKFVDNGFLRDYNKIALIEYY